MQMWKDTYGVDKKKKTPQNPLLYGQMNGSGTYKQPGKIILRSGVAADVALIIQRKFSYSAKPSLLHLWFWATVSVLC